MSEPNHLLPSHLLGEHLEDASPHDSAVPLSLPPQHRSRTAPTMCFLTVTVSVFAAQGPMPHPHERAPTSTVFKMATPPSPSPGLPPTFLLRLPHSP